MRANVLMVDDHSDLHESASGAPAAEGFAVIGEAAGGDKAIVASSLKRSRDLVRRGAALAPGFVLFEAGGNVLGVHQGKQSAFLSVGDGPVGFPTERSSARL